MSEPAATAPAMRCRHCGAPLTLPLADLGTAPPSNAYLAPEALHARERWYPLRVLVCTTCWLAQTQDFAQAHELFDADYAYFSSYSASWLAHARRCVDDMAQRFALGPHSHVVEVAANDGYLLQYVLARGIPCLGIEPTASTAAAARARGVPVVERFLGRASGAELAAQGHAADWVVANNVLAHVPDINDFVAGLHALLKPQGVLTLEFPHLLQLVRHSQFDTLYHEHFSYLSLMAVQRILASQGLQIFDVQEWPTHGGSLRVLAQRVGTGVQPVAPAVAALLAQEANAGMATTAFYTAFQQECLRIKRELLGALLAAQARGQRVAAYGAAAKGNTLLNFAGVRADLLPYVVDRNPAKQGKYLPGSRIPIVDEEHLHRDRPELVLILPWNLRTELAEQLAYTRAWGARLAVAVPHWQEVAA